MLAGGHCTCADAPCVDVIDGYYNKGVCPYRQGNSGIKGGRSRMHVGGDGNSMGIRFIWPWHQASTSDLPNLLNAIFVRA